MLVIRAILFLLFELVTVVPVAFGCMLCAPLPLHWRYRFTILWPRMVIWAARWILGIRWRVIGRENLPDAPVILLSKHQSSWETLFYPCYMPRELCFVFKRELLYIPFFGWGIALLDMIHIDRKRGTDAFESVVRQGIRKLADGRWIIMFPEDATWPVAGYELAPAFRTASGRADRLRHRRSRPARREAAAPCRSAADPSNGKTPDQLNSEVEQWIETEMRRISPHMYRDAA